MLVLAISKTLVVAPITAFKEDIESTEAYHNFYRMAGPKMTMCLLSAHKFDGPSM